MKRATALKKGAFSKAILPEGTGNLFLIALASIAFNYYMPVTALKDLWFLGLIIFYLRSDDEPFWLAVMLILNDGFAGFFGIRGVEISSLGLPDFELGHIYVIALVFKVVMKGDYIAPFYRNWLVVLSLFIAVLFIRGAMEGIPYEYNIYLRTIRNIFPFLLFPLIPGLMVKTVQYERLFSFIFLLAIVAFFTQLFSIAAGSSPMVMLGLREGPLIMDLDEREWRGLFNSGVNLMALFASLFYLASAKEVYPRVYLYIIMIVVSSTIFFSATRGWIIGFALIVLLFFIFIQKVNLKRLFAFLIIATVSLQIITLNPRFRTQFNNAIRRTLTIETVIEGDLTAGGTVSRITEQGPVVMRVWRESPFIGWGFSDTYYEYYNTHVGNQTILLHSGVVGYALLLLFVLFFLFRLWQLSLVTYGRGVYSSSLLVFPIFFLGWFFIHSTSGQQFGYTTGYIFAIPQSIWFAFGATLYRAINRDLNAHARRKKHTSSGRNRYRRLRIARS